MSDIISDVIVAMLKCVTQKPVLTQEEMDTEVRSLKAQFHDDLFRNLPSCPSMKLDSVVSRYTSLSPLTISGAMTHPP